MKKIIYGLSILILIIIGINIKPITNYGISLYYSLINSKTLNFDNLLIEIPNDFYIVKKTKDFALVSNYQNNEVFIALKYLKNSRRELNLEKIKINNKVYTSIKQKRINNFDCIEYKNYGNQFAIECLYPTKEGKLFINSYNLKKSDKVLIYQFVKNIKY